jgi:hypothetical protein
MHINELAYLGFGLTGYGLLDDSVWKAFGFPKRPKRGKFFDFLVRRQKLAIERFLMNEMMALAIVDIAQAIKRIEGYIKSSRGSAE